MINTKGRLLAAIISIIGTLSLLTQSYYTISEALIRGESFFQGIFILLGYFTILTNLWVTIIMARIAIQRRPGSNPVNTSTISAATLYIGIVGLIYHFVLSSLWHLEGWKKVADSGLHYIVPTLTVLFWIFFTPKSKIPYRSAITWMYYPLIYCSYSLIRGTITGWYPYPFLTVSEIGWSQTFINAASLSLMFYILGLAFIFGMHKYAQLEKHSKK